MRRCHACNFRYATLGNSWLGVTDLHAICHKLLVAFGMGCAAVLIMAATLWFSRRTPSRRAAGPGPWAGPAVNASFRRPAPN